MNHGRRFGRTGVVRGEDGGIAELAVPRVAAGGLVELVHGVRGVRSDGVGEVARPALLDRTAVHARLPARVVQVRLQLRVRRSLPRHAPPLRSRCPRR
ncbi:hypothetical protein B296_00029914 [Ensete ventricosum]|uniref:Uncharacterized protein n=1 Tax=Ensete ventricosum TaxID=4639 RepID=A0A427AJU2_ENSVE|nr:hypothetical protein B296_00029914 [Ensete ventricosum]